VNAPTATVQGLAPYYPPVMVQPNALFGSPPNFYYPQSALNTTSTSTNTSASTTTMINNRAVPSDRPAALSESKAEWDEVKLNLVTRCASCGADFALFKRRHHCRCCQRAYCDTCSTKRHDVPAFALTNQRVCDTCHKHLSST
jgi:hypothetical protein